MMNCSFCPECSAFVKAVEVTASITGTSLLVSGRIWTGNGNLIVILIDCLRWLISSLVEYCE